MTHSLFLAFALALVACRDQSGGTKDPGEAPSEREVEQRLRKKLESQYPGVSVETDKEARTLGVRLADGTSMTIFLDNVVHDCAASPTECNDVVDRYTRLAGVRTAALDRNKLGVSIKSHDYLESYRKRGAQVGSRLLAADLELVLTRDLGGDATALVSEASLAEIQVGLDGALKEAIARQEQRCTALTVAPVQEGATVSGLADADPVPCLAVASLWDKLHAERGGDLFVTAPTAAGVLVVRGAEAVADLRAVTERAFGAAAHPVSKTVLRWSAKNWVVYGGPDAGAR